MSTHVVVRKAETGEIVGVTTPVNFVTAPSGLFWARELPQMVKRFTTATKIGLTYVDVPTETNSLKYLRPEFARAGITIVDEEKVAAEEDAVTNMDSIVTRMRTRGAQAVVSTNPVLLVYGRLAASRQNWNAKWVGLAAWSKLVTDACGHTCDNSLITETAGLSFINRNTPQMNQFKAMVTKTQARNPSQSRNRTPLLCRHLSDLKTDVLGEGDPGTTPEGGRNAAHIRAQDRGESKQLIEIDRTPHCRRQEGGFTQRPEARNLFQESVDQ